MRDPAHHAVEDLARNVSGGKQTKAFDKVNHSKLIWKLHRYGIRGHVLSRIQAFFLPSN